MNPSMCGFSASSGQLHLSHSPLLLFHSGERLESLLIFSASDDMLSGFLFLGNVFLVLPIIMSAERSIMPGDNSIVCRPPPSWPQTVAMLVAAGFAWLMGWGLNVACVVGIVANLVVAILMPRRFGRWTE